MRATRRMGVLGGTFDPIHHGHLDAADAARTCLGLDEVMFIPAHTPPHRSAEPRASAFHRFALIALAIEGHAPYRASDVELSRPGRSFTIETLRTLHATGWRPWQLFFILGADAFAEIATWYEYPAVLDAANFAVIARPGTSVDTALARTPELKPRALRYVPDAPQPEATAIFLVEARTRSVSSTQIRASLAAGNAIADLVPEAVARHIAVHHLYEPVNELHG